MDGREGMALQGSTPYYMHRTIPSSVQQQQQGGGGGGGVLSSSSGTPPPAPPGFRPNPNNAGVSQPMVVRPSSNSSSNASTVGPTFSVEGSHPGGGNNVGGGGAQGFTITVANSGGGGLVGEPGKKKRGRPRKYGPDGAGSGSGVVSLGLSPMSPSSGDLTEKERKKRGRPPGSGRKQRLASVGEWMNNSAGVAFMPHVIHVSPGEDIAGKILSFSQQRPRALCIMSGSGGVSAVTLRQPASTAGTVTFEGAFEILCLSGSYLVAETGGSRNRTGGVNVSLSSSDGHVIGGAVGGRLVASRPVQVVVCSFVYGCTKGKSKEESDLKEDEKSSEQPVSDKKSVQINASSETVAGSWPGSNSKGVDSKNPSTDIDLASG